MKTRTWRNRLEVPQAATTLAKLSNRLAATRTSTTCSHPPIALSPPPKHPHPLHSQPQCVPLLLVALRTSPSAQNDSLRPIRDHRRDFQQSSNTTANKQRSMPNFPGLHRKNNVPAWQRLHQNHDGLRQWQKVGSYTFVRGRGKTEDEGLAYRARKRNTAPGAAC
jgi:hypothetical protein